MTDGTRQVLSLSCVLVGLSWFFGVEVWRGWSQEHSARVFWLHLTAPVVAIVLTILAIWLLIDTDLLRRARGLPPHPALQRTRPSAAIPGFTGIILGGPVR